MGAAPDDIKVVICVRLNEFPDPAYATEAPDRFRSAL
jgi:hypothetical protein